MGWMSIPYSAPWHPLGRVDGIEGLRGCHARLSEGGGHMLPAPVQAPAPSGKNPQP